METWREHHIERPFEDKYGKFGDNLDSGPSSLRLPFLPSDPRDTPKINPRGFCAHHSALDGQKAQQGLGNPSCCEGK